MEYRPPSTEAEIEDLSQALTDLITARLAHSSKEMREAARKLIQPAIRLASSGSRELSEVAHGLADFMYYSGEGLSAHARDALASTIPPLKTLLTEGESDE